VGFDLEKELNDETSPRRCQFYKWLITRPDSERELIWRAVMEGPRSAAHVARVLKQIDCPTGESSIQKHRKGTCLSCSSLY